MGKIAQFGGEDIKIIRKGAMFKPDENSIEPIPFSMDVDDPSYEELWSDDVILYHNPNAKYPLDADWFTDISQIWFDTKKNEVEGFISPYHILSSVSYVIETKKGESWYTTKSIFLVITLEFSPCIFCRKAPVNPLLLGVPIFGPSLNFSS